MMHLYRLFKLMARVCVWLSKFSLCLLWDHKGKPYYHFERGYSGDFCSCNSKVCQRCGIVQQCPHAVCY